VTKAWKTAQIPGKKGFKIHENLKKSIIYIRAGTDRLKKVSGK
jgi:hypothetical protein